MQIQHEGKIYTIRAATLEDAPSLRLLLNAAYKELADLGLNYTATYQDENITRDQILRHRVFVLDDGSQILATIKVNDENWFSGLRSLYIGKFAVWPELKRRGLGMIMMNYAEQLARNEGYEALQLDTAKPATHLVELYQRLGYKIIGDTHFEGKTYDSWIFEKIL